MGAYLGLVLIGRLAITLYRSVFAYIYAIVGIAFLLTLAPFFMVFFLFKKTASLFNKWLGYLASFTLQVIILFAVLAFILTMNVPSFLSNINDIIIYDTRAFEGSSVRFTYANCTLCEFKVVDKNNPSVELADKSKMLTDGMAVCTTNPGTPMNPLMAMSPPPPGTPATKAPLGALISAVAEGLLSLIILAVIVERLLANVPMLAQRLAAGLGSSYVPQLAHSAAGGGLRAPGSGMIDDFAAGFRNTMERTPASTNSLQGATNAIGEGLQAMVSARRDPTSGAQGAVERTKNWLKDPVRFHSE
jgi:type IV secretory pathway VirB6-like protein